MTADTSAPAMPCGNPATMAEAFQHIVRM